MAPYILRAGLVLCCSALLGDSGDRSSHRKFEPRYLHYRAGHSILLESRQVTTGPGAFEFRRPGAVRITRQPAAEPLADYFKPIRTAQHAQELCELTLWGSAVESRRQFEGILAAYQTHGFPLAKPSATAAECQRTAAAPKFGSVAREVTGGFDVAITAFVLHEGMGASAELARFHFRVHPDGRIEQRKSTPYLRGPRLHWQVASFGDDSTPDETAKFEQEQAARYAKRRRLILAIYKLAGARMPGSRP